MSLQSAIDTWLAEHHPHTLAQQVKLTKKKNKQGTVKIDEEAVENPLPKFLNDNIRSGTIQLLSTGRVQFPLTSHESPCTLELLQAHLNGKTYQKKIKQKQDRELLQQRQKEQNSTTVIPETNHKSSFAQYAPHVIPHKRFPKKLFCTLTLVTLPMDHIAVQKHLSGRQYQRQVEASRKQKEANQAKKDAARRKKQGEKLLQDRFSIVGTDDSKYDFSNVDFGDAFLSDDEDNEVAQDDEVDDEVDEDDEIDQDEDDEIDQDEDDDEDDDEDQEMDEDYEGLDDEGQVTFGEDFSMTLENGDKVMPGTFIDAHTFLPGSFEDGQFVPGVFDPKGVFHPINDIEQFLEDNKQFTNLPTPSDYEEDEDDDEDDDEDLEDEDDDEDLEDDDEDLEDEDDDEDLEDEDDEEPIVTIPPPRVTKLAQNKNVNTRAPIVTAAAKAAAAAALKKSAEKPDCLCCRVDPKKFSKRKEECLVETAAAAGKPLPAATLKSPKELLAKKKQYENSKAAAAQPTPKAAPKAVAPAPKAAPKAVTPAPKAAPKAVTPAPKAASKAAPASKVTSKAAPAPKTAPAPAAAPSAAPKRKAAPSNTAPVSKKLKK